MRDTFRNTCFQTLTFMSQRHTLLDMTMSERHDRSETGDLILVQEAATILRVTTRTIQRYIKDGHLPATRLPGGRLLRIRRVDVEALLNSEAAL